MNKKKLIKKSLFSLGIFFLFVVLVFIIIFKENDFQTIFKVILTGDKKYLIIAIIAMASFSFFEALSVQTTLKLFGNKISIFKCYKYALGGFFISGITPSSSGGDPMQHYLMNKDNLKVSHSTIALLVKLLSFQFVVILISLIGFVYSYKTINSLTNFKYLVFLGLTLNFLVFLFYFLLIFQKKIITWLVNILLKLLTKLKYKKIANLEVKITNYLTEFARVSKLLKEHKLTILKVILITLLQMLIYFTIPYFIALSLNTKTGNIINYIFIQAVLFVSVSALPFPGAVGISEVSFLKLYQTLFKKELLVSAMLMTRFVNFYLFIIYSGLVIVSYFIKENLKKK